MTTSPSHGVNAAAKLALIRSIVVAAEIDAGKTLSPSASAAIAWRTIGELRRVLMDEEIRGSLAHSEGSSNG